MWSFTFLHSSAAGLVTGAECVWLQEMRAAPDLKLRVAPVFTVRNQPLAAGDSKSAGLCVAPRSLRTKQIPGRGGVDLRLLGA